MNSNSIISVKNLFYENQNKTILEDVSFSVGNAEIITVIGPNGAGKTTLIKLILGLLQPTKGAIWRHRSLKIGYMPQKTEINPLLPINVHGLLSLTQKSYGIKLSEIEGALERVTASHLIKQPLKTLSGGEWQRILLARALLRQPSLLVLDEPAQGVDVVGQSEFYQMLANLRQELECAIILISHDLHLVMAATDQVICLNKHICCHGHPEKVISDPIYRKLFDIEMAQRSPQQFSNGIVQKTISPGVAPYVHHHDHSHDHAHNHDCCDHGHD